MFTFLQYSVVLLNVLTIYLYYIILYHIKCFLVSTLVIFALCFVFFNCLPLSSPVGSASVWFDLGILILDLIFLWCLLLLLFQDLVLDHLPFLLYFLLCFESFLPLYLIFDLIHLLVCFLPLGGSTSWNQSLTLHLELLEAKKTSGLERNCYPSPFVLALVFTWISMVLYFSPFSVSVDFSSVFCSEHFPFCHDLKIQTYINAICFHLSFFFFFSGWLITDCSQIWLI